MSKRIVICADGTWNRPEEDPRKDFPTNVLRLARAVRPVAEDGVEQQVFYDWGVGSYYDPVAGGVAGRGLHKNIMDDYRYIVQNYSPGDEIYLFGFSRGAYTVRCLCGLINNCGILKRPHASRIQEAFDLYKRAGKANKPDGENALRFRAAYAHPGRDVRFVGVWDTVGAMGIPISFLGLFNDKDEFYDTKLGRNVAMARHALAIDEIRIDFEPSIWLPRPNLDLKQTWFAGVHGDIGGGYKPDAQQLVASTEPLRWMVREAAAAGMSFEPHLLPADAAGDLPRLNKSRRSFYRLRERLERAIDHGKGEVLIHASVRARWDADSRYRPRNLAAYLEREGWPQSLE